VKPPGFDLRNLRSLFAMGALGRRNFALLWRRDLERSRNVTVLLDATVVAVSAGSQAIIVSLSRFAPGLIPSVLRARSFVIAVWDRNGAVAVGFSLAKAGAIKVASLGAISGSRLVPAVRLSRPPDARFRIFSIPLRGGTMFQCEVGANRGFDRRADG